MIGLEQLQRVNKAFTPAAPIQTEDLFAGRIDQLERVLMTVVEPGQHAVLYGERGVGKTSLANVVLNKFGRSLPCIKVSCDSRDTFETLWGRVLTQFPVAFLKSPVGFDREIEQLTFNVATVAGDAAQKAAELGQVLISHEVSGLIIIDEYDRIGDSVSREAMADLIKILSDNRPPLTILLVGVADDIATLVGNHPSIERCLRQIQLQRMSDEELGEILVKGSTVMRMTIDPGVAAAIVQSSRGFPHYTHLLGKHATIAALSEKSTSVTPQHFRMGVEAALEDVAASIREEYRTAVSGTKANLYKEVLLACALAPGDEYGTFRPRDMEEPLSAICGRPYTVSQFYPHLAQFCAPERGPILQRVGKKNRYRYRFTNPLMKPFVILMGRRDGYDVDAIARLTTHGA